jgi:hypothetical protein
MNESSIKRGWDLEEEKERMAIFSCRGATAQIKWQICVGAHGKEKKLGLGPVGGSCSGASGASGSGGGVTFAI